MEPTILTFVTIPEGLENNFSLNTEYLITRFSSFGIAIIRDNNWNEFYFDVIDKSNFITLN